MPLSGKGSRGKEKVMSFSANTQITSQRVQSSLEEFALQVEAYKKGEMSDDDFRKKRLWFGVYKELGFFMQRVKLPYGRVSAPQLRVMADLTRQYSKNLSHLTTRQDLEFHWMSIDDLVPSCRELLKADLHSREGCGDTVRNITGDFRAGYIADEVFDYRPYAEGVYQHFLLRPENQRMPRKFKISFSSNADDHGLAVIHDVGLICAERTLADGAKEQGFRLLAAGGLGKTPRVAHELRPFISFQELIPACEAIVQLFDEHGNRENRKRARLKYVAFEWGEEKFNATFERLFAERLKAVQKPFEFPPYEEPVPDIQAETFKPDGADPDLQDWFDVNVIAQKQTGFYMVQVPLELGDVTSEQLNDLASLTERFGNGHACVTQSQKFVFKWVAGQQLTAMYGKLKAMGLSAPEVGRITDIVACPGTDFCEIGFASSIQMSKVLRRELLGRGAQLKQFGPFRIHISGCTNSCGQHHIGNIGLIGYRDVRGGVTRDLFQILIGGGADATGQNVVGEKFGLSVPAADVPGWVNKLLDFYLRERQGAETFKQFVVRLGAKNIADVLGARAKKAKV